MGAILAAGYFFYSLSSFLLLFRDERALGVIARFYPVTAGALINIRSVLLHLGLNSYLSVAFGLLVILLFWVYYQAIVSPPNLKTILFFAVVFLLITFISYPALSTDVFDYILSTRLFTQYGQNVWQVTPISIPSDPFYNLASWQSKLYTYGPVNLLFYSLVSLIAGNDLMVNLMLFKGMALVFAFLTIPVYYLLLKEFYPKQLNRGLVLLFWNPLYIIEIAGSAHNNILAVFFMGLGIYLWKKKKIILSAIALSLAVEIKFLPLILMAFLALNLLRDRKFKQLLSFVTTSAVINLFCLGIIGSVGIVYILLLGYGSVYWQSLPMLTHRVFPQSEPIFLFGFFLIVSVLTWRFLRGTGGPLRIYTEVLLLYFLFFTGLYWNWYALWLLPVIPLLEWGKLAKAVVMLTFTSLMAYPAYWLTLRFDYRNPVFAVIIYMLLVAPTLVVYLYARNPSQISE